MNEQRISELATPITLQSAGDTHIGGRDHNEDTILLRPDLQLYAVADGAGGENAGNVASALATTAMAHWFEQTEEAQRLEPTFDALGLPTAAKRLAAAVQRANRDIIDIAKNSERHHGMGTTIVAAHIVPELSALHLAYVGDSRCYRLRDGRMELLTHDHTLIHDVLELKPDLSEKKALDLPRHVITRALGMGAQLRVSVRSHSLLPGDVYLLCSDGLTDEVEESEIVEALLLTKSSEERVHLLIDLALEHQAEDNIAAVVIHCELTRGAGTLPKTPRTRERPIPVSPLSRPPKKRTGTSEPSPSSSSGSSASRVEEDHSYPEIIVVQEDVEPEDRNTNVFVVPQSSALKPGAIDAAKQVVAPVGVGPLSFRCTSCGVLLKHDVKICGICGTPVRPSTRPQ